MIHNVHEQYSLNSFNIKKKKKLMKDFFTYKSVYLLAFII